MAVDDETGTVVVGAPFARAVDHFNRNTAANGADGTVKQNGGYNPESVGAVYVFSRTREFRDGFGRLTSEPVWPATEHAKLQPPVVRSADLFGHSVAIDGYQAVVGAPRENQDVNLGGVGSTHTMDLGLQQLRFDKKEVVVNEFDALDDPGYVELTVRRAGDLTQELYVGYATSDITATGISEGESLLCLNVVPRDRGECGDYILKSGIGNYFPHSMHTRPCPA